MNLTSLVLTRPVCCLPEMKAQGKLTTLPHPRGYPWLARFILLNLTAVNTKSEAPAVSFPLCLFQSTTGAMDSSACSLFPSTSLSLLWDWLHVNTWKGMLLSVEKLEASHLRMSYCNDTLIYRSASKTTIFKTWKYKTDFQIPSSSLSLLGLHACLTMCNPTETFHFCSFPLPSQYKPT